MSSLRSSAVEAIGAVGGLDCYGGFWCERGDRWPIGSQRSPLPSAIACCFCEAVDGITIGCNIPLMRLLLEH